MHMFPRLLQSKIVEQYLTTRKQEVGPWLAQFALEELKLLDLELEVFRKPIKRTRRSSLIVGNNSYPLFQHLSPALAALERGDQVSLYLPNQLPLTSTILQEVAASWGISTISDLSTFDFGSHAESFLWWQSRNAPPTAYLDSFTTTSICIPSPTPFFIDDSANFDQVKTLVQVLWEKKGPGFLPQQFWVPRSWEAEIMQLLKKLGEKPIQGEAYSIDPLEDDSLYVLSYRSVRQVTESIANQGLPNLIYWFSRYKPTVKAAQQVASICGIALNGILPSLQQKEMEIGAHRANWLGTNQEMLGFKSVKS